MKVLQVIHAPQVVPHENEEDNQAFNELVDGYDESWEDDNEDLQQQKDEEYAAQYEEYYCDKHQDWFPSENGIGIVITDDWSHHGNKAMGENYTYLVAEVIEDDFSLCWDYSYKYGKIDNCSSNERIPARWVKHSLFDIEPEYCGKKEEQLDSSEDTTQLNVQLGNIACLISFAFKFNKAEWSTATTSLVKLFNVLDEDITQGFQNEEYWNGEYIEGGPEYLVEFTRAELEDILCDVRDYVDHSCSSFVHKALKLCGWKKRYNPGMTNARGCPENAPVTDMIDRDGVVRFRMEWW